MNAIVNSARLEKFLHPGLGIARGVDHIISHTKAAPALLASLASMLTREAQQVFLIKPPCRSVYHSTMARNLDTAGCAHRATIPQDLADLVWAASRENTLSVPGLRNARIVVRIRGGTSLSAASAAVIVPLAKRRLKPARPCARRAVTIISQTERGTLVRHAREIRSGLRSRRSRKIHRA